MMICWHKVCNSLILMCVLMLSFVKTSWSDKQRRKKLRKKLSNINDIWSDRISLLFPPIFLFVTRMWTKRQRPHPSSSFLVDGMSSICFQINHRIRNKNEMCILNALHSHPRYDCWSQWPLILLVLQHFLCKKTLLVSLVCCWGKHWKGNLSTLDASFKGFLAEKRQWEETMRRRENKKVTREECPRRNNVSERLFDRMDNRLLHMNEVSIISFDAVKGKDSGQTSLGTSTSSPGLSCHGCERIEVPFSPKPGKHKKSRRGDV